jgi:VWFA-related protein
VTRALIVLAGLFSAIGALAAQDPRVVYRATVDWVTVVASVRDGRQPVPDLRAQDFDLRDAGTVQTIAQATFEAMPMDLTFVVDISGSIDRLLLASLTAGIDSVLARLRPDDRASIITFNHRIFEAQPLTSGLRDAARYIQNPDGFTSLVDATTLALLTPGSRERRQMIILFTDGMDKTSFTTGASLIELAQRREVAIFTVALFARSNSAERPPHESFFKSLAQTTGGLTAVVGNRARLGDSFLEALDDFRSSYVLRYTYEGPPRPGWHPIEVRVKKPGSYTIRARQGYLVNP